MRGLALALALIASPAMAESFVDEMLGRMPPGMTMPSEIVDVLRRMEAENFVRSYTSGERYMLLYPDDVPLGYDISTVGFVLDDRRFMEFWSERPGADADVFVFAKTGGDGSRAGIWRDPDGRQHFVHLGSGSGSTWAGVMTDDPATFLRCLAVGYSEACWTEVLAQTPLDGFLASSGFASLAQAQAAALAEQAAGREAWQLPTRPPEQFQRIVAEVTGLPIPATGAELIPPPYPDFGDPRGDPFQRWLAAGAPAQP